MKASNKEEDITPFINKNDLENKTRSNSTAKGHEKVILRRIGLKSMLKNFILSYLIFFGIIFNYWNNNLFYRTEIFVYSGGA